MTMTFKTISQALALMIGCMVMAQPAMAAKQCKPQLKKAGMFYFNKDKAKSSAAGRWEKQAAIKHGIGFSFWSNAKGKGYSCTSTMKNGKKLYNCIAKAKPCKTVAKVCKSKLSKKGMFYFKKAKAKSSAVGRWEKQSAIKNGIGYSFWSNAKSKSFACSFSMKNGKKLWNCAAKAKPCKG